MSRSQNALQAYQNNINGAMAKNQLGDLDLRHFQENEVGMSHWANNSVMAIRDNGCVDIFVAETTGIRLDPTAQSANYFSPKINLYGTRTHIRTDPYNFLWNGWKFNPEMYEWCKRAPFTNYSRRRNFTVSCTYEVLTKDGWETRDIGIRPYSEDTYKETYSPEVKNILDKLGIKI